jgi:hypothetical protein
MQDVKPFKVTVNTAKPTATSLPARPATTNAAPAATSTSTRQPVVIKPSTSNADLPEEVDLLDQFEPVAEPYVEATVEPVVELDESSTKIIRSGGIMSRFRRSSSKNNTEPEAVMDESGSDTSVQGVPSTSGGTSSAARSSESSDSNVASSTQQPAKRTPVMLDIISSKPTQKAVQSTEVKLDSGAEVGSSIDLKVKSDAKVEKKVELDDSYWDKAVEASSASSYEHEDLDKAFLVSDSSDESEDSYLDQIEDNSGAVPTEDDWSDVPEKPVNSDVELVKELKVEEKPAVKPLIAETKKIETVTKAEPVKPATSSVAVESEVTKSVENPAVESVQASSAVSTSDSPSGYLFPKPQTNSATGDDPLEDAAQAAQDSLQDPKIYDTKHYHVPIAHANSTSVKSKALIALGFVVGVAAIAAVLHVMGVIKLPVNF